MSIVGMIHIRCGQVGQCGGHVFAVDADDYLRELTTLAVEGNGTFTYPKRYCPRCESRAKQLGYRSERETDAWREERAAEVVA